MLCRRPDQSTFSSWKKCIAEGSTNSRCSECDGFGILQLWDWAYYSKRVKLLGIWKIGDLSQERDVMPHDVTWKVTNWSLPEVLVNLLGHGAFSCWTFLQLWKWRLTASDTMLLWRRAEIMARGGCHSFWARRAREHVVHAQLSPALVVKLGNSQCLWWPMLNPHGCSQMLLCTVLLWVLWQVGGRNSMGLYLC